MSSHSFPYEESVLSHLEKVQELPAEIQTDIARRVENYLTLARFVTNEDLVARIRCSVMEERAKAIGQGVNSTLDPRWAAPAIAEAWCYAKISLSTGYLNRQHAEAIIGSIDAFISSHLPR